MFRIRRNRQLHEPYHRYVIAHCMLLYLILCAPSTPRFGVRAAGNKCSRLPDSYGAGVTPADGRFHVRISENTAKYTPGKTYTINLEGIESGKRQMPQPVYNKFSGFKLVVESRSAVQGLDGGQPPLQSIGVFSLMYGDSQTKLTCGNMVTHTTTAPKRLIRVLWTAPETGYGCVVFRATVIENRDTWYMDDGALLSKDFCEDDQTMDGSISSTLQECCACAEAKYEMTFEGLWSRNTHPKDFPSNRWVTRFSDLIGATHTPEYRFWSYGDQASSGMKQVAERGMTMELESELKNKSSDIRTIIKARGLAFPNVLGRTFAVFRVDRLHHLLSFATMIDPSPDWFLGVSALELCTVNCSWVESKVLELYPWDAGTDSGITYDSFDQPTMPADKIRLIRPDQPNDPRSPFYDTDTNAMKPFARLYLLRQRLYEKQCPDDRSFGGDGAGDGDVGREAGRNNPCALTPWTYGRCSSECSAGTRSRQRSWVDQLAAEEANCRSKVMSGRVDCVGRQAHCTEEAPVESDDDCAPEYMEWSDCLPKCGNGTQSRPLKKAKQRCEGADYYPPVETRECENPKCVGEITPDEEDQQPENGDDDERSEDNDHFQTTTASPVSNNCLTSWSHWTPCSATCGGGQQMRYRQPKKTKRCQNAKPAEEPKLCNETPCDVPDFCYQDPIGGGCRNANATNMYFFNRNETRCDVFTWTCGRHRNRFRTDEDCMTTCTGMSPMLTEKLAQEERELEERRNNRRNRPNRYNG